LYPLFLKAMKRARRRVAKIMFQRKCFEISDSKDTISRARAEIESQAQADDVVLPTNFKLFNNGNEVTEFVWGQFLEGTLGDEIICRIPSTATPISPGDAETCAAQSMPAPPFVKNPESAMREQRMAFVKGQMGTRFREYTVKITIREPLINGEDDGGGASSFVTGKVTWTWPFCTDDVEAGCREPNLPAPKDASVQRVGPYLFVVCWLDAGTDPLFGELIEKRNGTHWSPMAVVCGMCASRGENPQMEFELLSEAQGSPLRNLHERMVKEQSVLWIPKYGNDNELHLLAVSVYSDERWCEEDNPIETPMFLGFTGKRNSPEPGKRWTGSPVLRECHRLWRDKTPLVLDLDETLGCCPIDCFGLEIPAHLLDEAKRTCGELQFNYKLGMSASQQVWLYHKLTNSGKFDRQDARWVHGQVSMWLKVQARVAALKRLLQNDLRADASGLMSACDKQYFRHEECGEKRALLLRRHLKQLLTKAMKKFDIYIVTAATHEHAKVFLDGIDSIFTDEKDEQACKPGTYFRLGRDESGQVLKHALGRADASERKKLATTSRTSHFSTIIVDDCNGSHGIGRANDTKTWPDDEESVYTVKAWNPLLPASDNDKELEELAGWDSDEGLLSRCQRNFFDKLCEVSRLMQQKWYCARTNRILLKLPRMDEEVRALLRDKKLRPHSPPGELEECLMLDTNLLINMSATDPDKDIAAANNYIQRDEDSFKLLKEITIQLMGQIKLVIPYIVVAELDKLKGERENQRPTARAKAAARANRYLQELKSKSNQMLEIEEDPVQKLNMGVDSAWTRGDKEAENEAKDLRQTYRNLKNNDERILHQAQQRVKCVIATNDNNMQLRAEGKGIDCLKICELSDYVFNHNGENAQTQPPSVWVARIKSRNIMAMEAKADACTALPSTQGGIKWYAEESTTRPGMQKFYFKWPNSQDHLCIVNGTIRQCAQYDRPTAPPPVPWYYKDSREDQHGPFAMMMSKQDLQQNTLLQSLVKRLAERQIGPCTLVRSELTNNAWVQLHKQLPTDGAGTSRGPM